MERQNIAVEDLADRLLEKLAQAIEELEQEVSFRKIKKKDENGITTETVIEVEETVIDRAGLKQLTAVLKELQSIKAEFSSLELEESRDGTGVILLSARKEGEHGQHPVAAPGETDQVSGTAGI